MSKALLLILPYHIVFNSYSFLTMCLMQVFIPKNAITIIINEVPKTNWATGGILASELKVDGFIAP